MKPIPEPVYPCKHCSEEYSWPATNLNWSSEDEAWVCDDCWDCEELKEEKGVCLADEIKKAEAKHDAEVIMKALDYLQTNVLMGDYGSMITFALEDYANQLRQKAQESLNDS